jgi:hypothetical protein
MSRDFVPEPSRSTALPGPLLRAQNGDQQALSSEWSFGPTLPINKARAHAGPQSLSLAVMQSSLATFCAVAVGP